MLCSYGKRECLTIMAIGLLVAGSLAVAGLWWPIFPTALVSLCLLAFFRDPERRIPTERNAMVSPADGKVTSVHQLDHYAPLGGPATCIRIFLSVLDVHVNRAPCHSRVESVHFQPGGHLNALKAASAKKNESNLLILCHPNRPERVAAVRQVAGLLARTIVCVAREGQIFQRGQRFGMIKLGSTTELYLPENCEPKPVVQPGQHVRAGQSIVAYVTGNPIQPTAVPADTGPEKT
ncbi:MAG: phosphatidylserine decarboxylase family protein [Phycisphaeraceae bacterium]|nr:phosphatidylserine decarboxylase family protein [Phycisphaeraceae bacterium]